MKDQSSAPLRPCGENSARILVVEDELPMRTALEDCLAGEGFRVITAADGERGLERALKEKGIKYKVGKFPFTALGKAKAVGETDGFVKLLFDEKYGELLGAHLIGPEVTELLQELVIARAHGATGMSILKTVHAHPTLSEAIMEAAAVAEGEAIHI